MPGQVEGKVVAITGATGGMGTAMARGLAQEGASLVLMARSEEKLATLAKELTAMGAQALSVVADVADLAQVETAVDQAIERFGHIDALINNAALQGPAGRVWETDVDEWLQCLDVNVAGVFRCCRAVLPSMVERRQGVIINVSSGAATSPMPYYAAYAASKAAVSHFSRTLAAECSPEGINVNCIGVSGRTDMWRKVISDGEAGGPTYTWLEGIIETDDVPLAKENVALVVFLCSDAARHITGQYIEANSFPEYVRRKAAGQA